MQVTIPEQPIHSFDVMFDVRFPGAISAHLCQRGLAAHNQRLHYANQRHRSHRMTDNLALLQPS
jgi:hypothetical protein